MKFPLDWLFLDRWYWITIFGCCAVMIAPIVVISIIVYLPSPLNAISVIGLIVGWGIAGGYRDWAKSRKNEEKPSIQ